MALADEDDWDESSFNDSIDDGSIEEDDDSTDTCPYCRREIYIDASQCPYCKRYISEEDEPGGCKPWWVVAGAVLCLAAVYFWFFG